TASSLPKHVTAIRLETLPDDSLPAKGPGRSNNGNFVLTEITAFVKEGNNDKPLMFKKASADFSQDDYPVANAINGKENKQDKGWAIYPQVGQRHMAVFEFAQAVSLVDGTTLTIEFRCRSGFAQHQPGRIRIAVTTSLAPHNSQSLPENVTKALAAVADQRTAAQQADLRRFFRETISDVARQWQVELQPLRDARNRLEQLNPTS